LHRVSPAVAIGIDFSGAKRMALLTRRSFVGSALALKAAIAVPSLALTSDVPRSRSGVGSSVRARSTVLQVLAGAEGTSTVCAGGLDGGGQVTGLNIANDGWMVCRNDTDTANIRGPSAASWDLAFRWGDNVSVADYTFKNPQPFVYEICFAPSDSNFVWAVAYGYLFKSTDRTGTWTRQTTYKKGAFDSTQGWVGAPGYPKIAGQHMAVDPFDTSIVGVGHPVDGLYFTTNGGLSWTLHPSVPAPINSGLERRGINIAFDVSSASAGKAQTVVVNVPGRGIFRSTTGLGGTFSLINETGAPPNGYASDIAAAGGRVFCVGDVSGNNSQLYIAIGTTWSQPSGISGTSVDCRRGIPSTVLVMSGGGGMFQSTDSGTTWEVFDNIPCTYSASDVPWVGATAAAFLSLGQFRWHPTLDRIYVVTGIGAFYLDNPPRSRQSQRFQSITLGIRQVLVMDVVVTPTGRVLLPCQDRPLFQFTRADVTMQASDHKPNYTDVIRHGNGVDFAADDENYQVLSYTRGGSTDNTIMISSDGGTTWHAPRGATPSFQGAKIAGGNVAVGNKGNIVWCPTSKAPMYYTLDHGSTWAQPKFGDGVDMTGVIWHHAYFIRRKILWADKSMPGRFLAYCPGLDGSNSAADLAASGLWESTNGGANWSRVRSTRFESYGADYWAGKLRPVPGYPDHLFWVRGNINNYPEPPSPDGLWFSSDKGRTIKTVPGFLEVEDIGMGKSREGGSYPRLMVRGWRGGKTPRNLGGSAILATWESNDFNPARPKDATWTQHLLNPGWRIEDNALVVGDMHEFGRFYHVTGGGGFFVDDSSPPGSAVGTALP
jgi:hypothetical protein